MKLITSIMLGLCLIGTVALTGCQSTSTGATIVKGITPDQLGYDVAAVYLLSKNNLDEREVRAIKNVYEVFDTAMTAIETGELSNVFNEEIDKRLKERLGAETPEYVAARLVLTHVWNRLDQQYQISTLETLVANERFQLVSEFHKGIERALTEFSFLNKSPVEDPSAEGTN